MLTHLSRAQKRAILYCADTSAVLPAIWIAQGLRAEPWLPVWTFGPALGLGLALVVLGSWCLGVANIRISAYEERAAGKSLVLSGLAGLGLWLAALLSGQGIDPGLIVLMSVSHFAVTLVGRLAMAHLLRWAYRSDAPKRRVLIYGAGTMGQHALSMLRAHPDFTPVGFIDDGVALRGLMIGGIHVHPPLHLAKLAGRLGADDVVIARPDLSPADRAEVMRRLDAAGLRTLSVPAFAHLAGPETNAGTAIAALDRAVPALSAMAQTCYRDRVVMVTGAGGSIGSELAHQILDQRPARLVLVELNEFALYRIDLALRQLAQQSGVALELVLGSVADAALMRRIMETHRVDIVLHAAAYKHVPLVEANPASALANNALGTESLARVAAAAGVGRFVLISTDKAVRPASTMGVSKWVAEQVVRDIGRTHRGFATAIVRFGNVLGSSGSVLPRFQEQVQRGGPVTITDPRMERYFMSVEEAVHLVLEAGALAGPDAPRDLSYVFDMGAPVRIEDLARRIIRDAGYSVRDAAKPDGDIALHVTGRRPGEKLREDLTLSGDLKPTRHPRIFATPDQCLSQFEVAQLLRQVRQAVVDGTGLAPDAITPGRRDAAAGVESFETSRAG